LIDASLARRGLSLLYEALLLAAVLIAAALPLTLLVQPLPPPLARALMQLGLVIAAGLYFVPQWVHGRRTLPMKTWRLRLIGREGRPLCARRALCRYLLALAGTLALGAGFLWALVDPDRRFLHDRLAGTRIVHDG
jgi:uncharacterized RDD family membrane protein YckC